MDNFRFFTPTEVVFGKGVENQTGALAAKHGTRALIVYGKGSVVKSGLLARVMQSLKDAGIGRKAFKRRLTFARTSSSASAAEVRSTPPRGSRTARRMPNTSCGIFGQKRFRSPSRCRSERC